MLDVPYRDYVGTGTTLHIVNAIDPTAPSRIGRRTYSATQRGEVIDVELRGDLAILVFANRDTGLGTGYAVVDVTSPTTPQAAGALTTSGAEARAAVALGSLGFIGWSAAGVRPFAIPDDDTNLNTYAAVDFDAEILDLATDGDLIFAAAADEGLMVVEPRRAGPSYNVVDQAGNIVADGDRLYLSTTRGLAILTVDDPVFPTEIIDVKLVESPGENYGIKFFDDKLCMARGSAGVIVVDVRDPDAPRVKGPLLVSGKALDCTWTDDRLAVLDDLGVQLVHEFWDSLRLSGRAFYSADRDPAIGFVGGALWVTSARDGTAAFAVDGDAIEPHEPILDEGGTALLIDGSSAWLAAAGGVEVWDATDPFAPVPLGRYDHGASSLATTRLVLEDERLYVLAGRELHRIDISDHDDLFAEAIFRGIDSLAGFTVAGSTAYTIHAVGSRTLYSFHVRAECEL